MTVNARPNPHVVYGALYDYACRRIARRSLQPGSGEGAAAVVHLAEQPIAIHIRHIEFARRSISFHRLAVKAYRGDRRVRVCKLQPQPVVGDDGSAARVRPEFGEHQQSEKEQDTSISKQALH